MVPTSTDNVFITVDGTYTVTLDVNATVASLTLGATSGTQTLSNSGITLTLEGVSTVNSNGVLNLSGGVLTGSGTLTVNGTFNWTGGTMSGTGTTSIAAGAALNISGGAFKQRTLDNAGTATWSGGGINDANAGGGVINNLVGAVFDVQGDQFFDHSSFTGVPATTINNAGTFRKSTGSGTARIEAAFNNTGVVEVLTGTLSLTFGGSSSGPFNAVGAGLEFGGDHTLNGSITANTVSFVNKSEPCGCVPGTVNVNDSYTVSGSTSATGDSTTVNFNPAATVNSVGSALTVGNGTVNFNSGEAITATTITLSGGITNFTSGAVTVNTLNIGVGTGNFSGGAVTTTTLDLSGGTLTGSSEVTVSGMTTWTSGTMSGTNPTTSRTVANGGLNISGSEGKGLVRRTIDNAGTATWSGGGIGTGNAGGGVINNLAGAVFDVQGDQSFSHPGFTGVTPTTINNAGTFRKSAGSGTAGIVAVFNNTGTVEVLTGTLSLTFGGSSSGPFNAVGAGLAFGGSHTLNGSITANTVSFIDGRECCGTVNVNGSYTASGSTSVSGGMTVNFNPAATVNSVGSTLTVGFGTVNFNSGEAIITTTITLSGGITNFTSGAVTVNTLNISGTGNFSGGAVTATTLNLSGGTLTGSSEVTVSGMTTWTSGTMSGTGKTVANGGLSISGGGGNDKGFGQRTLDNAGTATWSGGNITNELGGGGGVINNLAGAVFDVQGDQIFKHRSGFPATTINNAGTFRKSAGSGTASIAAVFNNTGTVEVLTGTLSFPQFPYTQTAGATVLNGGNLTSTQTLNIQGGILAGVGTVSGNVNNAGGQVNPGGSPGIFNITGNYTQGGSGALNIEIGGLTVGSQFDRLQISGAATLNGTLNISLINSFVPSEGDSFQVLTFGSRSGDFATYNGLDIDGRLRFEPSFTANSLVLNVALAPNSPPDAVNDTPTTAEDTPVTINVLSNDTDPNLDLLTVSSVTQGSNGMVTINANTTVTYTPTLNFNGTDMFTYTVSDGRGGTDTATVTVTVTPVNDAPDAINDSDTTLEDTPVAILVLSNDSDVDGDTLTLVSVTQAGHGTVVNNGDGTVTYTPNLNFNGTDSFSYMISDGNGGTDTAIVGVTVTPTGDPPNAVNDTETTAEDTAVDIAVLANDSDPDNDTITLISVTNGSRGTVTINPNGTVRYTPSLNFNGTDTFTYTISDGDGATDAATVTVTVTPVPDPPNAENDTRTTPEDTAINIAVLANDSDPDGDSFSLTSVTQGAHGSVTLNANGTVTYTPNLNFNGSDSFTYTISGSDGTDTATVTVNVTPVNDPPDAVDDTATAVEETDARIVVRSNDSDVDGDPITVISVTQGSNGQVFLNADQTVTYLPNLDFNGIDTFTYTISDSHGVTDTATVTVTVIPVNDKPVANNDSFNTDEDMVLTMPAPGVLGNDSDVEMDALMAVLVTAPSNGSLMFNPNGAFAYTPNAGFNGTDSFTYKANDGSLDSDVATVTINVGAVNDAPVAVNDSYSVNEDSTLNVAAPGVLSNDSDEDVDALTAVLVSGPTRGMLTLNSNGSFSYTPNANFNGTDAFSYKANDGQLDSNVATVTITVNAVNDPPVAVNDAATTPEETVLTVPVPGVLGNDADVDGNALTAMLVNEPANGTLTLNANGSFTYTPNLNFSGIDSFTYKANDGTADSNVATVTVTVLPGNHPPVAANDSYSVNEDVVLTVPAPGVLSNDSDEEGVALTAVLVSGPSHGSLTLNSNGSFTYTPNANFNGTDSFTYRANDGELDSPVATVTITINPVNDAPVAVNDSKSTNEDTALTFPASDLTANDSPGPSNESSQTLTVTAVSATANTHGIVSLIAGNITYMPTANFNGSASFTYTVSDGQGGSDTATVTVTVTPVNDVPDAVNDAATTNQNTAVDIAVLANDIDVDDDTLMVVSVTQGANGSVGINANGTVRYAPSTNFSGTDSFTYTINDGHGGTDTATVTITVIQTNMPPTANAGGPYNVNEGGSVVVTASGSDPESGPLTFAWDLDNNGTFETPGQSATFSAAALDGPSTRTITVRVTDNGGLSATAQTTVNVLNVAPTVGPITAPVDPIEVGTSISASAGFTDPGVGDTHTAVWKWGDGSTSAGSVSETNGSGSVRGNHPYTAAGVYTVGLTVTDDDGGSGQSFFQYVVVFDPSAGFVTGGGWIDSPAGAYAANPSLTGKANFGFVAKFKPGSSQVIGETEFNFPTAGLNFHSTGYDWLVITGPKAQFKGSGRINRTGDYAFLVTINDGQATGGGGVDKVRIKIWNKATGEVVYDNQRGDPDDANATDEIEGGSIVIHNR